MFTLEGQPSSMVEKTLAEDTISVTLKNGREVTFPRKNWYRVNQEVAGILSIDQANIKNTTQHIRKNDPSIEVTTPRKLMLAGRLEELGAETDTRSQTLLADQKNLIKLLNAITSPKEPKAPPKAHPPKANISLTSDSQKPRDNTRHPFNFDNLNTEKPPKEQMLLKEKIKDPRAILGENAVIEVLFNLVNGTLKEIARDLKEFLEEIANRYIQTAPFKKVEKDFVKEILGSDSPTRLSRFFRVKLEAMLDDLWHPIDIEEKRSIEQNKIKDLCSLLKQKSYTKERVIKEICEYFKIPFTPAVESPLPS